MPNRMSELAGQIYQDYLDAGYREYQSCFWSEHKKTSCLMGKWIRADGIKLFQIHMLWYDWTQFGDRCPNKFSFQFEVQLNTKDGKTFNAQLFGDTHSPKEAEDFFMKMYKGLDCSPYDE